MARPCALARWKGCSSSEGSTHSSSNPRRLSSRFTRRAMTDTNFWMSVVLGAGSVTKRGTSSRANTLKRCCDEAFGIGRRTLSVCVSGSALGLLLRSPRSRFALRTTLSPLRAAGSSPCLPNHKTPQMRGVCGRGDRIRTCGPLLPKQVKSLQRHLSSCLACRILVAARINRASLGTAGDGWQAHSGTLEEAGEPAVLRMLASES